MIVSHIRTSTRGANENGIVPQKIAVIQKLFSSARQKIDCLPALFGSLIRLISYDNTHRRASNVRCYPERLKRVKNHGG